jgi:transcriptional regulator with XRE-family HTH domain
VGRVPSRIVYHDQVAILRRVSSREKTKAALAAKLDISREWLDRVMSGEVALGAETCLHIALEYGEDALSLMRAAGKGELADLLERAGFGGGEVSASDRDFLRNLDSLPEAQQQPIRELIRSLSTRGSSPTRKSRKRS